MITEKYTDYQIALSKRNENIGDDFDELEASLEIFGELALDNKVLSYGLNIQVKEMQDKLKSIEYKLQGLL